MASKREIKRQVRKAVARDLESLLDSEFLLGWEGDDYERAEESLTEVIEEAWTKAGYLRNPSMPAQPAVDGERTAFHGRSTAVLR